jgi:type I restriction enzyme, S subunit
MSFPRYPDYADSNAGWLGRIPTHWGCELGRRLFAQSRLPALPEDLQLSATQKYGVIPQQMFMELEDQKVVLALTGLDNFKHVEVNDFVISLRSFQGGIERCKYSGCVSPAYTVLNARHEVDPSFMEYLLKAPPFIAALQSVTDGIREGKNISYEQFGSVHLPLPSIEEQRSIAAFLTDETAKIDTLVAEQEQLITLLKEKRQAVISHAVTKGLDPSMPMKDSGVEWLGKVPAHWRVCSLKRALQSMQYGISETLDIDGDVAVLRMGNIQDGSVVSDDLKFVKHVESELLLKDGDLLYNRTNSIDLVGKVGIFKNNNTGGKPMSFASYLVRLRVKEDCIPQFFSYLLNTDGVLALARSAAFVSIGQCNLNPTRYGETMVALPPQSEQISLAAHLDEFARSLDDMLLAASQAILFLQERRSALISAAVTGQIDVRGLATSKEAA